MSTRENPPKGRCPWCGAADTMKMEYLPSAIHWCPWGHVVLTSNTAPMVELAEKGKLHVRLLADLSQEETKE